MNSQQIFANFQNCKSITEYDGRAATAFNDWQIQGKPVLGWDTETTGLDRHARLFGISLAFETHIGFYTAWARKGTKLYLHLKKMLEWTDNLVAHMARFDIRMMSYEGMDLSRTDCTYTMSRIINDRRNSHDLESLTEIYCPELSGYENEVKKEFARLKRVARKEGRDPELVTYEDIDDSTMSPYAQIDAFRCLMFHYHLWPTIQSTFAEVYDREKKIYNLIRKVEAQGLHYSWRKSLKEAKPIQAKADACLAVLQRLAISDKPFTYWKDVLNALLFLGVPIKLLKVKGKVTTGADNLREKLDQFPSKVKEFVTNLLDMRSYAKVVNTYLLPLAAQAKANDDYVYTEINPADTVTSRMASRNPNLMNVPKPINVKTGVANPVKDCFICGPDEAIYYFDNEQMEMAYFGMLTGCDLINESYANGGDLHMATARQVYGPDATSLQRQAVKAINFGILFGTGETALAKGQGWSRKDTKIFLHEYHEKLPEITAFQARCKSDIRQYGYVQDIWGKRYHVTEAYKAVNCHVQGGCAQAFKEQMLAVDAYFERDKRPAFYGCAIVLPVHDEIQVRSDRSLIHEIHDEWLIADAIITHMADIPKLTNLGLRLRVKAERTVTSWSHKKEIKL